MTDFTLAISAIARMFVLNPLFLMLDGAAALFSPLIAIARVLSHAASAFLWSPFTLFSRFEALYVFCGSAAVVGVAVGSVLGLTTHSLAIFLNLQDFHPSISYPRGRHRSRAKKHTQHAYSTGSAGTRSSYPPTIPTILEEEDEDLPLLYKGKKVGAPQKSAGLEELWPGGEESFKSDDDYY